MAKFRAIIPSLLIRAARAAALMAIVISMISDGLGNVFRFHTYVRKSDHWKTVGNITPEIFNFQKLPTSNSHFHIQKV